MKNGKQIIKFIQRAKVTFIIALFFVSANSVFGQNPLPPSPQPPPRPPQPVRQKPWKTAKVYRNESGKPAEKSIAADFKVNISLCVSEGNVKINGWDRNEIRAFVNEGSEVGFNVREKNKQNNNVVWVIIQGFDQAKNPAPDADECLSGEEIELDVPRGAVVSIKSQASETTVDSVAKARVENVGGDIFLSNIAQGIFATTYEGDVTVEKSSGAMTLASTTGNIVAFNVSPSEIGDIFKAKTSSGAITLQQVEHRQMEVNSNSGSMKYIGLLQNGGQYTFGTLNGSMQLLIPEKSSCKLNASYGFGAFDSQIPLQNIVKTPNSKTQSLSALMGGGDANVNLRTYSGVILIRKQ